MTVMFSETPPAAGRAATILGRIALRVGWLTAKNACCTANRHSSSQTLPQPERGLQPRTRAGGDQPDRGDDQDRAPVEGVGQRAAVQAEDRLVGVRRAHRPLRPGAARGLRPVRRRARGRDGPAHAPGRHHGRADRDQRGCSGCRRRSGSATCGCCSGCSRCSRRSSRSTSRRAARSCPSWSPPDLLPAANSLNITVFQAGAIAGPLVGGVLIPVVGLLVALPGRHGHAVRHAGRRRPAAAAARSSGGDHRHPGLRSVVEGLAYLRGHPVLLMSFVVDLIAMVFGMPRALFPEIAHDELRRPGRAAAWRSRCSSRRSRPAPCSAASSPAGSRGSSCRAAP